PFEQLNQPSFALPDARAGLGYGASLYADGGTPPYHNWQLVSGALPAGMVLDQARGVVRGSSSAVATYSFGVDVLDGTNAHAHNPANLTYTFNVSTAGGPSPTPTQTPSPSPTPTPSPTPAPLPIGDAGAPAAQFYDTTYTSGGPVDLATLAETF